MPVTRILLATDSAKARRSLSDALAGTQEVKIIATASNLMAAYGAAEELIPDVAIVDYRFTKLEEFEMVLALFGVLDIRWVAVGAEDEAQPGPVRFNHNSGLFALECDDRPDLIVSMIRSLSWVARNKSRNRPRQRGGGNRFGKKFVLIGSSTGGVDALTTLLSEYPEDCPPTLIVQHTGKSFGTGLVNLLDRRCPAKVYGAKDGLMIGQGQVCVMAGSPAHMQIHEGVPLKLRLVQGDPISGHIPSVDALFQSAVPLARNAVAVLLTGMGRDGADGMLALRRHGARTIAQDAATSVVYGMPRVAWESGAAEKQLPLTDIKDEILAMCKRTSIRTGAA